MDRSNQLAQAPILCNPGEVLKSEGRRPERAEMLY
jgi:hypothetical protein